MTMHAVPPTESQTLPATPLNPDAVSPWERGWIPLSSPPELRQLLAYQAAGTSHFFKQNKNLLQFTWEQFPPGFLGTFSMLLLDSVLQFSYNSAWSSAPEVLYSQCTERWTVCLRGLLQPGCFSSQFFYLESSGGNNISGSLHKTFWDLWLRKIVEYVAGKLHSLYQR